MIWFSEEVTDANFIVFGWSPWADPGGGAAPSAPPPKIGNNTIFWLPPLGANFLSAPP